LLACAASFVTIAPSLSASTDPEQNAPGVQDEIDRLRSQLRDQQQEIESLRKRLDAQQMLLEKLLPTSGQAVKPASSPSGPPANTAPRDSAPVKGPLSLSLGGLTITPTGFLDFMEVWRSRTVASGLATNFSAIPFTDTVLGQRQQTLSSAANSRLGVQVSTRVRGVDLLGLVEMDFRGYSPNNIATTINTFALRMRLAFLNMRKNRWEFLAGQNWSLLTPARKGISPYPDTLFLTQDLDPNVQSGLVWARTSQVRLVYHAGQSVAMGFSFESGDAYSGGPAGGGTITLPAALTPSYFGQVDLSTENGNAVPNQNLDWVAKIAFDPKTNSRSIHFEVAGLMNRFVFYNPLNNRKFSIMGGGIGCNAGIETIRHLTVLTNNFYTNGGGNFIFGEVPALIVQATGAPSLMPAASTVDGLEYEATPRWRFWTYYGATWIHRISTFDPVSMQAVGYGYAGSPDNQNRTINEVTGGFTRVLWKNTNYGTLQFSAQYSWVVRRPWYVAAGRPGSANLNMFYLGLRYLLPGPAEASN
jgi:hypothetical protein